MSDTGRRGPRHAVPGRADCPAAAPDVTCGREGEGARGAEVSAFLAAAGWAGAARAPLAGDASGRRYQRLRDGSARAVLMDAPPAEANATAAFVRIAGWLSQRGFSAPDIFAAAPERGLLLLEDFGDDLFARRLDDRPGTAVASYDALTDCLVALHRHAPPAFLPPLDGPALGAALDMLAEWYIPGAGGVRADAAPELSGLVAEAHARLDPVPPVLALRDCHAGNLVWLPGRAGVAALGLLDFQDAVAAHPAYDLVSALQDARRDLPAGLEARELRRYADAAGIAQEGFRAAYALLGAQRGLRIMGIFARLAMDRGRPGYLVHLPRVWRHVEANLAHPALAELAAAVRAVVPPPAPERLERIAGCGNSPTR